MYTMRPLLSWQYFTQSSILYQLHMKSTHGLVTDISALGQIPVQHDDDLPNHKPRRLEESMYWSCFKSESEFRVELPLPQSELATYYHPQMFPSPPSPADVEKAGQSNEEQTGLAAVNDLDQAEAVSLRQHAKQLCNEEESWYYYLTEIALRRIGNRIINTFFRQDPTAWLDIKPWLSIALEFDVSLCPPSTRPCTPRLTPRPHRPKSPPGPPICPPQCNTGKPTTPSARPPTPPSRMAAATTFHAN